MAFLRSASEVRDVVDSFSANENFTSFRSGDTVFRIFYTRAYEREKMESNEFDH